MEILPEQGLVVAGRLAVMPALRFTNPEYEWVLRLVHVDILHSNLRLTHAATIAE